MTSSLQDPARPLDLDGVVTKLVESGAALARRQRPAGCRRVLARPAVRRAGGSSLGRLPGLLRTAPPPTVRALDLFACLAPSPASDCVRLPDIRRTLSSDVRAAFAGRPNEGVPRHPIVEDDVSIYAGATILGRVRVGRGALIGGNVWLTRDVPPGARVIQPLACQDEFSAGGGI